MKDAAEYIGIACVILAVCFGCSHCNKTDAEVELLKVQAKQVAQPAK